MKRVALENRAQKDKFGTGKHGFTSGNPSTGVLATIPGSEWFDHVQEEITNVIESTGVAIDSKKYNQLLTAINKLIVNGVNNTLISTSTSQALSAYQGKLLNDNKADKSKTLSGYGIEDWKIENITTANASQANSSGQGVFSFATVTSDAPKWSNGEGIGANKMLQLGPDSWNTQVAVQGYGECFFIRSRRTAGGPYQSWKRLDGGDWAATEEQAGHIANKPNIAKTHLPSGYARLSNGTIIQWGAVTAVNGQANWVYPIAFPNAALQVFASQDGVIGVTYTVGASVDPAALKTQAKVTSTLTSGSDAFSCFAIGY